MSNASSNANENNNKSSNKQEANTPPNHVGLLQPVYAQNQAYLNQYYQSQYSSMSGTNEYSSNDLFLDEELLNNYQQERVRLDFFFGLIQDDLGTVDGH